MAHLYPATDDFQAGAPVYGDFLTPWIRTKAWNTDPAYGSGGTGYSLTPTAGEMFDGYFAGSAPQWGQVSTPCVFTTGSSDANPSSFLWRKKEVEDCQVMASFFVKTYVESIGSDAIRHFGVGARINAGTQQDAGLATEHYDALDGYWFALLATAGSGYKYELLRVNGGTVTRLADSPSGSGTFGAYGDVNNPFGFRLYMNVETNGAQVDIECYRADYLQLITQPGPTLLISHSDTDASRITGNGRAGLLMSNEYSPNGTKEVVHNNAWFRLRDWTSGGGASTIHVEERWKRQITFGKAVTGAYASGRHLATEFLGDMNSVGSKAILRPNSADNDELMIDRSDFPGASQKHFWCHSIGRDAANPKSQNRQIDFELDGTGTLPTENRQVGVWLYGSNTASTTAFFPAGQSYNLRIQYSDNTGVATAVLWRHISPVDSELLASVSATIALNTTYTLRLEVSTSDSPISDGPVTLRGYLDGVQLVLAKATADAGVTVDAAGTVTDGSSDRITSGLSEGWMVYQPDGDRRIYLDNWQENSSTPTGLESDQATVTFPDEADGKTGTLSAPYRQAIELPGFYGVRKHTFGSSHVNIHPRDKTRRRRWDVSMQNATEAEKDAVLAFFDSHNGTEIPFDWVDPSGATRACCFGSPSITTTKTGPNSWSYRFTLVQVFDAY